LLRSVRNPGVGSVPCGLATPRGGLTPSSRFTYVSAAGEVVEPPVNGRGYPDGKPEELNGMSRMEFFGDFKDFVLPPEDLRPPGWSPVWPSSEGRSPAPRGSPKRKRRSDRPR
jgi:hypothetical protein